MHPHQHTPKGLPHSSISLNPGDLPPHAQRAYARMLARLFDTYGQTNVTVRSLTLTKSGYYRANLQIGPYKVGYWLRTYTNPHPSLPYKHYYSFVQDHSAWHYVKPTTHRLQTLRDALISFGGAIRIARARAKAEAQAQERQACQ